MKKNKIIRTSTVPESMNLLLKGQLQFLSKTFDVIAVSTGGELLEEVKNREKVEIYPIKIKRKISPINDSISLIKLYFYFRKEKPQIVHSITPKAGLLSMVAAKFAGVPIRMHTFTGLIFPYQTGALQKLLIKMDKLLCYCATAIYPEGQGVKDDLLKYKITKKNLNILANGNINGVDVNYYNPENISVNEKENLRKKLGISNQDFVFIFVGRLVNDKGINELVEAFIQLKQTNAKLLLVGSLEEELDPLKRITIQEIRTNPNIISVGFKKNVIDYFSISDALVFPSHREGFPNVVLQAGAMQLPSIVTNISGSNEIIDHNENGIIIPVKSKNQIAEAMNLLMNDSDLYKKLQSNSRIRILQKYRREEVWEAQLNEYEILLRNKGIKNV